MTIHTTDKGRVYLTAGDGCWLTNDALYTPGPVYLGKLDSPDNWRDVETPEGYEWRQNEDGVWELVQTEPEDSLFESEVDVTRGISNSDHVTLINGKPFDYKED